MTKYTISFILLLIHLSGFSQQTNWCGTDKIQQDLKQNNPSFAEHMHKSMVKAASQIANGANGQEKATLYIPVVIHIIHDNGIGNISDEQVESAMTILNEDYNRQNADAISTRNTPNAPFQSIAGIMDVKFKLAKIDPDGNCTNGIIRVNAPNLTYNIGDDCKYSALGGSDQWPMDKYLNIWVVNSIENDGAGTILGYAYLPYWPSGTDYGILIRNDAFGNIGTAQFADGRTLTHEMGHLLGLQHIFDAGWSGTDGCHATDCYQNGDYSCDTPPQGEANWSCSPIWNSCPDVPLNDAFGFDALDQIENYMSYNACQNMFSQDQIGIMHQNFIDIGFLANMVTAQNILETGINDPEELCKAEFDVLKQLVCSGTEIQFNDRSFHNPTLWTWTISPGAENVDWQYASATNANSQNPVIQFLTEGNYQIELFTSDGITSDTEIKTDYITVLPESQAIPFWEGFEGFSTFAGTSFWNVYNPNNNNAFEVNSTFGLSGNQCAKLINYGQSGINSDELISSAVNLSALNPSTETVSLSFRYAYRKRYASNDEWLKVFISKDCGDSWVQRKTIHGNQLSSDLISTSWAPSSSADWVTVHMTNITSDYIVENFRFKFEFEGQGGNNFYLDDINLYQGAPSNTVVLGLDQEELFHDLELFPNPADNQINLQFSLESDQASSIIIQDVSGKIAQSHFVNTNAGSNLVVLDTKNLASGVYMLTLQTGGSQKTLQFVVK